MRKEYENRFRKIIKLGVEEGGLKNVNAEVMLYSLLNSVHWLHKWYKPEGKIKADELEKDIIEMLMGGVMRKG
jgi:hypothetical protein